MPTSGLRGESLKMTLYQQTLNLIRNRPVHLTLIKISQDTNIPKNWLSAFTLGKIDPKFQRLQELNDYLVKQIKQTA
jgi:hypothetical protein